MNMCVAPGKHIFIGSCGGGGEGDILQYLIVHTYATLFLVNINSHDLWYL